LLPVLQPLLHRQDCCWQALLHAMIDLSMYAGNTTNSNLGAWLRGTDGFCRAAGHNI